MRSSKTTVQRHLDAYKLMSDKFLTMDDGKFADQGEGAWSYFEELYKSKDLRDEIKKDDQFTEDFCRWVGDDRLPKGENVRKLPDILKNDDARKRFECGATKKAFEDALKIVAKEDPSIESDFFKLLAKVRESLTSAAQVKEILRIRTDKAARRQVLETYEALIDFMHLAEVEPDEVLPKKKSA